MLKGNAYTVGKIMKLFTRKSPLKVLDMDDPLFEKNRGEALKERRIQNMLSKIPVRLEREE
jgi:hypothetical protein